MPAKLTQELPSPIPGPKQKQNWVEKHFSNPHKNTWCLTPAPNTSRSISSLLVYTLILLGLIALINGMSGISISGESMSINTAPAGMLVQPLIPSLSSVLEGKKAKGNEAVMDDEEKEKDSWYERDGFVLVRLDDALDMPAGILESDESRGKMVWVMNDDEEKEEKKMEEETKEEEIEIGGEKEIWEEDKCWDRGVLRGIIGYLFGYWKKE
ncbi:hypothetical protein QBC38DRAFT_468463 [Podospora fimiseda]|uniref:Uncharacterized protein n=1 Tax=Podospora fimiseda TaxID=252190 RepID=A0AAN7BW01_9PEZI|nr:hypothetical protein QBC38DRAFT_468463 [Podospora fimiseda]